MICVNIRNQIMGKFVTAFRHAKVVPIHKKGDVQNLNNYRPISLLSSFSKILEKIVYRRLYSFFDRFNLFSNSQFGFRRGHSTSMLIVCLLTKSLHHSKKSFVLSEFFLTSRKLLILLTIKFSCINLIIMALEAQP